MVEEKTFDKQKLRHLEKNLKTVSQLNYDLCQYKCNEMKSTNEAGCKQACFDEILVPFNMIKHEARSPEEILYKKCLASKFPNISQKDFITCSNDIYADRVELMMNAFTDHAKQTIMRLRN